MRHRFVCEQVGATSILMLMYVWLNMLWDGGPWYGMHSGFVQLCCEPRLCTGLEWCLGECSLTVSSLPCLLVHTGGAANPRGLVAAGR
jgi:hypothetical protein